MIILLVYDLFYLDNRKNKYILSLQNKLAPIEKISDLFDLVENTSHLHIENESGALFGISVYNGKEVIIYTKLQKFMLIPREDLGHTHMKNICHMLNMSFNKYSNEKILDFSFPMSNDEKLYLNKDYIDFASSFKLYNKFEKFLTNKKTKKAIKYLGISLFLPILAVSFMALFEVPFIIEIFNKISYWLFS